jgi:metal-sulfur cluster biosynthetic enzyme
MRDLPTPERMGLVEHIACRDGYVRVELVLTDASCVHFAGLQHYIADVLTGVPGVDIVEVTASRTTLWTPERRAPAPATPVAGAALSCPSRFPVRRPR